jgi:hypothetical protein
VLACQALGNEVSFSENLTAPERNRMFRNALKETEEILAKQRLNAYSYCGRNCHGLVRSGLAKDTGEHFSDWMANRASSYYFARIPKVKDRQQASALGQAMLCDEAGVKREAASLAAAERDRYAEGHPDDRIRRISVYDDFVAQQLSCSLETEQGFAKCEP